MVSMGGELCDTNTEQRGMTQLPVKSSLANVSLWELS